MLYRQIVILFFLFASNSILYATHVVGGDITYRCLGNDQYEVKLTIYRDCFNGRPPFDSIGYIGVFDRNWILADSMKPFFVKFADDTLPIILDNPCLKVPPDVCVHKYTYVDTVLLPFKPGGYTLAYQRCCRNQLILNILNPTEIGDTFIAEITEETMTLCNSGAVFKQWPPVAICVNYPLVFDHGAIDPDGDSIVYRLCTPFSGATANASMPQPPNKGPYIELDWAPGYSLDNLLGGVALRIDPKTGLLTGTPNRIGNFVVGVCAEEYRKGQLISITRRDFQFNVSDCGTVSAAFFTPNAICDTRSVKFNNTSTLATSYKWFFDWDKNKALTSNLKDPVFTYPDTGFYNVALIINPGGVCADTFFKKIHVTLSSIDADLEITYPECNGAQLTIKALDKSADPVHGIKKRLWRLTGPGPTTENSQAQNPEFKVSLPGTYTLRLIVTAGNECQDTLIKTFKVPIPDLEAIKTDYFICKGDTVSIYPNFDPDFDYTWTPQTGLNNANTGNPKASPDSTTTYKVVISGDGPCVRTAFVTVNVTDAGKLLVTATPDTIFKGQSSQLLAVMPGATFTWSPANSLSDNKISNPKATPDQTTDYTVMAQIGNNCTLKKTIRIVVLSVICDLPYVFFPNAFSPNGDNENDFLKLEGVLVTEAYWAIYNRWGEKVFEANSVDDTWDGSWRGQPQPAETYGYYLRVRCLGEPQETVKKGNVTLLR